MAIFNPNVPQVDPGAIGSPNTYLGWSKGTSQPEVDKSKEYALKGIGDSIEAVVKSADFIVKDNIKEDIYNEVDAERQGYTDALEYFSGAKKTSSRSIMKQSATPNSPQDVQNVNEQTSSLKAAYDSGKISNTYYYGRLNTLAKTLRSQYPGYRDYIDQQISSVTGVNPANAYITSLLGDINRNSEKKDADVTATLNLLRREDIFGVPGAAQRINNIMRNPTAESIAEANEWASKQVAYKADENRREAVHKARKMSREDANWTATDDLNVSSGRAAANYADNLVYNVQNGDGTSQPRKISDIVNSALQPGGAKPSTEQAIEMSKMVQAERNRIFNEQFAKATKIIPGTNGETLASRAGGNENARKIINDSLAGLDTLSGALSKENYTLAADAANTVGAIVDDTRRGMYANKDIGPYTAHVAIIRRDFGEQAAGDFFKQELDNKDNVAQQFRNYAKDYKLKFRAQPDLNTEGKPSTVREAVEDAKNKGIKDKGTFDTFINQIDRLTDPRASVGEKQNLAVAYFDPSNRGMMANFNPRDRDKEGKKVPSSLIQSTVWSKLTSDKVTAEMKKLGGEHWNNYTNWVQNEFGRTMQTEVLNLENAIQSLPKGDGINSKIGWDNVNKRFILDVNGTDYLTADSRTFSRQNTNQNFVLGVQTLDIPKKILNNINSQLYSLNNIYKQQGGDVDAYIYSLLDNMQAPKEITKEILNAMRNSRGLTNAQ